MKEVFKPIKAYPNYKISNLANVVSNKQGSKKYLKKYLNQLTGKTMVHLYDDAKKSFNVPVYKLMSEHFPDVVFKEAGVKNYNTVEGIAHRGASKLNDNSVHAIIYFLNRGISASELAKAFKIDASSVRMIRNNKTWKRVERPKMVKCYSQKPQLTKSELVNVAAT